MPSKMLTVVRLHVLFAVFPSVSCVFVLSLILLILTVAYLVNGHTLICTLMSQLIRICLRVTAHALPSAVMILSFSAFLVISEGWR